MTLSIIRSSCPPSHHWTSQGFHFAGLNLTGRSFRVAWGGAVSKANQLVTGVHIIQAHSFSYHCYADDTQLYLSFRPDDPTVATRISDCLTDISAWMKEHHLQLILAKTELLVFPATQTLQHDFTIQLGSSTITPSSSVRNLWWTADLQRPHCKDCSVLLVCITQNQKDQALSNGACFTTSCPGPCHFQAGLLQCSSGWTSIKHNQTSTNDSECGGTTGLQRAQKSPCYTSLYLLALATAPSCSSHQVQNIDVCI